MGYAELPVIDVDVDPLDRVERIFKRALDLVVVRRRAAPSGFCPGFALAAAIKLDSRGPVFYKQERLGRNGRHFFMYKFRTMVVDADASSRISPTERERRARASDQVPTGAGASIFKMKDDPRITRVGRVLRKWSLDELPQMINVYKGDMSLVGPRPPLPREVENYESGHYCASRACPGSPGCGRCRAAATSASMRWSSWTSTTWTTGPCAWTSASC